jgi:methionyl-tRNA formyltransferase
VSRLVFLAPPVLDPFQLAVVEHILAQRRDDVVGCLIDDRPPTPLRAKAASHLRRARGGYIAVLAIRALRRRLRRRGEPLPPTAGVIADIGARVIRTADPYDATAVDAVTRLEPDMLLLIGGFGIVKDPLLSLAPSGVLSYHHGDMRRYRGQPAGFWELYNGERSMGVTVQRLAAGIDCGEPIVERRYEIRPDDTLSSLMSRVYAASADMLREAIERVESGQPPASLETLGAVYTLPNLRQWLAYRWRIARRRVGARARSLVSARS